ncbi:MAG: hypothetical protein KBT27_15410, partial [Prevotellaceae bacterium]|nr:hypothetical protein [Candidatus Faecinaster equi]
ENQCLEKLAFVLLALAKYENARSSSTKDTLYAKIPEIFRLARLAIPKAERNKYLHTMYKEGIISMNFSIGYDAITVGFISHNNDDPVVLNLDEYDYMELAYAYLNYKNGGYKRCKVCNKWFKTKTHEWYCRVHRKAYESTGIREVECIDCGMVFQVPSTNTRTCRCEECQKHATLNKYAKYNAKRNS